MYFLRFITIPALLLPVFTYAKNTIYTQPLTRIPGITDEATLSNISTFGLAGFFNGIITFTFIGAAIASVIMIVMIGFQYATTEKSGALITVLRGKIKSVAFGAGLIASMYIIFRFINPDITDTLNIFSEAKVLETEKTTQTETQRMDTIKKAQDLKKTNIPTLAGADAYVVEKTSECSSYGGQMQRRRKSGSHGSSYIAECRIAPQN